MLPACLLLYLAGASRLAGSARTLRRNPASPRQLIEQISVKYLSRALLLSRDMLKRCLVKVTSASPRSLVAIIVKGRVSQPRNPTPFVCCASRELPQYTPKLLTELKAERHCNSHPRFPQSEEDQSASADSTELTASSASMLAINKAHQQASSASATELRILCFGRPTSCILLGSCTSLGRRSFKGRSFSPFFTAAFRPLPRIFLRS